MNIIVTKEIRFLVCLLSTKQVPDRHKTFIAYYFSSKLIDKM